MQSVKVFAPATVANLNCGFDVLGLAIDRPGDIIEARFGGSGLSIAEIKGDHGLLPKDIELNTAGTAAKSLLEAVGSKKGIELRIEKQMPIGSGLGSSAASAVGAVVAINKLLETNLSATELLPFAMEGEKVASGSYHADNVAPCLMGGIILISTYDPLTVIKLPAPRGLWLALVHPDIKINTKEARALLPDSVSLKSAVKQNGNVAGLVSGFYSEDYELISRSLKDELIEQHRSDLIPGFEKVREAAESRGALGCGISGSGPSIFAFCKGEHMAQAVGAEMKKVYTNMGILANSYVSNINSTGPKVLN